MTDANKEWEHSWGHEREQAAAGTPAPNRETLAARVRALDEANGILADTLEKSERDRNALAARLRESERERKAVTSAARKLLSAIDGDYMAAEHVALAADRLRDVLRPHEQGRERSDDEPPDSPADAGNT